MVTFLRLGLILALVGCASGGYYADPSGSGAANDSGIVLWSASTSDAARDLAQAGSPAVGRRDSQLPDSRGTPRVDQSTAKVDTSAAPPAIESYTLTRSLYHDTDNLNDAVKAEFGPGAVVADWADLKTKFANRCTTFLKGIGLLKWGEGALLYSGGQRYWSDQGTNRHYFMERHDGTVKSGFLVHDNIESHVLDLGSWTPLSGKVLVKVR